MTRNTISRVEVSQKFWEDLGKWRKNKAYPQIRRKVAEFIERAASGEVTGEASLKNKVWAGVRYCKIDRNVALFTMRPEPGVIRLCALEDHGYYGFGGLNTSRETGNANRLRLAAEKPSQPSPQWQSLSWTHPSEIGMHPELPELSRDALDSLYREVLDEAETLFRLREAMTGMSDKQADAFADRWFQGIEDAQQIVEASILDLSSRRVNHLAPQAFKPWLKVEADEMEGP